MNRDHQLFIRDQAVQDLCWDMVPSLDQPPFSTLPYWAAIAMAAGTAAQRRQALALRIQHDPATRGIWMLL